jgi:glycolate oxidase FAD binding subunit
LPVTEQTIQRPKDTEGVLDAIKSAAADGKTVRVIGADTKHDLGRPLSTDLTCDLSSVSGITLLEPEELVMTAKAGTPLAEIEAALEQAGQQLAFEPLDLGPTYGHQSRRPGREERHRL